MGNIPIIQYIKVEKNENKNKNKNSQLIIQTHRIEDNGY